MARTTIPQYILKHIKKKVAEVYPIPKLGDCISINSTVAYFLHDLGYEVKILQGYASLDREIYDRVLEQNRPETAGITDRPDHVYIKVYINKARRIYDFAKEVFGQAKILSYSSYDDLYGKENKKLYNLLRKGK
jgi:hypothetical protein